MDMIIPVLPTVSIPQAGAMARQFGCQFHLMSTGKKFLVTKGDVLKLKRPFLTVNPEPPTAA